MDSDGYLSQLADIFNGITVNTPSISAIIAIALAGVLLLASGFASASEIAFFSLSPSDRNDIDERNHPSDDKISALLGDTERLLATILITNNFVNVTIIMLCNFFFILKSATKPLNVLIAFTRPLITEFADNLNLKHPLLPTISPYPTM